MSFKSAKAAVGHRVRTARAAAGGSAIVLTYHRVVDLAFDPQLLAVSPRNFEDQLMALSDAFDLMTVGELFEHMASRKRLPRRAVAVTMDDGYRDALTGAKPILDALGAPATVFVSSDCLDDDSEFWWDQAERAVLVPGELPQRLDIRVGAQRFARAIKDAARSYRADEAARDAVWNITSPERTFRQQLYLDLCDFLRPLPSADRRTALASLREQVELPENARATHRTLDHDALSALEAGGAIEIGAHTRSHSALASLAEAEQRDEIEGSKRALEDTLGHPVTSLSYPHGGRDTYSALTERIVREAGFSGACANHFGIVLPWADRFAIPRCPTENIGGEEFLARVEGWFDAAR